MEGSEYLSPRALGRAVGLSESSVRRWADDGRLRAERTAGGHRRIARAEAVRFIRETGLELVRPDLLGFVAPDSERDDELLAAEVLLDALRSADSLRARRMLVSAFLDGAPLASLCDGPIRRALRDLGVHGPQEPEAAVHEHHAVDVCLHALMEIRSAIPERGGAPVALGGAVEGDPYLLPSVMASVVLADAGFRAFNLGPDVPSAVLLAGVRVYAPVLVWRSATILGAGRAIASERRSIGRLPSDHRPELVVGGRGASPVELRRAGGVQRLSSMAELAGFARAFLAQRD